MTIPVLTAPATAVPQLGQDAATFDANMNNFLPELVTLRDELTAVIAWVEARATGVSSDATQTGADRTAVAADRAVVDTKTAQVAENAAIVVSSLAAFQSAMIGDFASDAAADAWAVSESVTLTDGMFYYKSTAPKELRILTDGTWGAAVLDANGSLMAANNLSELDPATALENLGLGTPEAAVAALGLGSGALTVAGDLTIGVATLIKFGAI